MPLTVHDAGCRWGGGGGGAGCGLQDADAGCL